MRLGIAIPLGKAWDKGENYPDYYKSLFNYKSG